MLCLKNYRGWTVYGKKRKSSKDLRDASGPSVDPSAVYWNIIRYGLIQWKDGCQEAIFKEEWLGGKVEVCYIAQELDCVSVNMFDGGIRAAAKDFGCRLNCQFFVVVD